MRATFITGSPNAACSMFYADAFRGVDEITLYDDALDLYGIVLVMTYDHNLIKHIKHNFPHIKIGIIDPRSSEVYESTKLCDFIIVDSIEMEDYWRVSKKPIFRYVEYPNIPYMKKIHEDKSKITVGYHGNQGHLDCMSENVTPALSELGKKYKLELLVMHNGTTPTGKEKWHPDNITVTHIPWSMENYVRGLFQCDIGIVPNNLIHDVSVRNMVKISTGFNYNDDDYSLRFKMPSNPGRFVVFGKLGIPVVADFYPSALQYLKGDTGFVAHNESGWHYCLEKLITSKELRQKMGDSLQLLTMNEFDFKLQNKKLISFLESVL